MVESLNTPQRLVERESVLAPDRLARASGSDGRLMSRSTLTVASRGAAGFVQLGFLVAAGRLLSLEEFAGYSYLFGLAIIFSLFGETGVGVIGSRDIGAGRLSLRDVFWSTLPVALAAAAAAALVMALVGAVDSGPGSTALPVALAGLFVITNRVLEFSSTLLRTTGRFELEAGLKVGSAVLFVAGSVAVAAAGLGLSALMAVLWLKELLTALLAYAVLKADVGAARRPQRALWRPLLRAGVKVTVASAGLLVVTRSAQFVLGNAAPTRDIAYFSAVLRFADASFLLATAAGAALLPGLAFLAAQQPARVRRLVAKVAGCVVGLAALAALIAVPLAEPFLRLLYGPAYAAAAPCGRVLLAGLPVYTAVGLIWFSLLALDAERSLLVLALCSAAVAASASVVLVQLDGDVGASWAYLLGHLPLCVGGGWVLWRKVGGLGSVASP